MLWFVVLPFLITIGLSAGLILVVYFVARRKHVSRMMGAFTGILVAAVAFVPLCILVYTSPFRFGDFHAADTASVRFTQVRHYLPPSATDIDMITTPQHHHVRFCVSKKQLLAWMKRLWEVEGKYSPIPRSEAVFGRLTKGDDHPGFARLEMNPGSDFMYFEGPYRRNWGGPTLWYDTNSETAWQFVAYCVAKTQTYVSSFTAQSVPTLTPHPSHCNTANTGS